MRGQELGLKLDLCLLRPRVGLFGKGGGPSSLCDLGAESWPVLVAASALSVPGRGARSSCAVIWLLVRGGAQGQGEQAGEAWLSHQPTGGLGQVSAALGACFLLGSENCS